VMRPGTRNCLDCSAERLGELLEDATYECELEMTV